MDITVKVIGYKLLNDGRVDNPLADRLAAEIYITPKGADLPAVIDIHLVNVANGNRLIRELYIGSEEYGIPACPVGSLVKFTDCKFEAPHFVTASGYEVVKVVLDSDPELMTNPNYLDFEPGYLMPGVPPHGLNGVVSETLAVIEAHNAAVRGFAP